jgi:uncharacterized protein YkwD
MKRKFLFGIIVFSILVFSCGKNPTGNDAENLLPRSQVITLENTMFTLLNQDRDDNGLSALIFDEDLRAVAVAHSEDMFVRDFFSHTNPDGEEPSDRVTAAGISYLTLGENIAKNSGFSDPVDTAEGSLMKSPEHRANILSTTFTHVGIGIATDGDVYYFTQLFVKYPAYEKDEFIEVPLRENPWNRAELSFEKAWNLWQE